MVAAGTGGHVFPALALADALKGLGLKPVFAGRPASLEEELARKAGFEFRPLASSGFFGKGPGARLQFVVNALRGAFGVWRILNRVRPAAVVAAGGFGSVVPLVAARLRGIPYFLLEQNRIPGRVTRYFGKGAQELFLTFPLLKRLGARTVVSGTPLRRVLLDKQRHDNGKTILVLGGSLGARALNFATIDFARQLPELHFLVQTGRRDYAEMQRRVQEAGLRNIELIDFTLAMEDLYSRASLVLSRAGGMVINEVLAFGLPSILVPFPFATDNHQKANAQHVAREGGALQIDQSCLPEVSSVIRELFAQPQRLEAMAATARRIARRDAAERIARRIVARLGPVTQIKLQTAR
jgi:UDP-N-acetylglucosamine--N-acetylmuramyl-(pentapeptide) pyrophosphoryl-undecaprenol N-acetylglucosamine transferase